MTVMDDWPPLPYEEWRETRDTLHMFMQIVGKVRLALEPMEPQWAQVPLYLTARGLNTSPIPHPAGPFDIDVDLIDHGVTVRTTRGRLERVALRPQPVADFYAALMAALAAAGVPTEITELPSEVPDPIPFPADTVHKSYDPEAVTRFWRALSSVDIVLKAHRARFRGTCYRACGFEAVGPTKGFTRASRDYYLHHDQPKQLYLRELQPRARNLLRQARWPEELACHEACLTGPCPFQAPTLGSLLARFATMHDSRRGHGLRHRQRFVLACAAVSTLMGACGYRAFENTCKKFTHRQLRALGCQSDDEGYYYPPSDSTFQRVLNKIDASLSYPPPGRKRSAFAAAAASPPRSTSTTSAAPRARSCARTSRASIRPSSSSRSAAAS
jgi:hypothetical protein